MVLILERVDSQEEPALVDTTTQTSEAPKDEQGKAGTPKQETPKEEAPKQDVPQKEAPKKEVPAKAELPNTGAESMVEYVIAGLSSLVAGLGTLVSKKRQ